MAKAFLLRWGTQNDFDEIKLHVRELGFTIDNERLWLGGNDENIHIPNEQFLKSYVAGEVPKYQPVTGTTTELQTLQAPGALGYNTEENRLSYKTKAGQKIDIVSTSDLPLKSPISVVVAIENIDTNDDNSVLITGYNRPIELIFLNGKLCTKESTDSNRYEVDDTANTLKVYGCSENDIISYF